jgi:hypothetical protein
MRITRSLSALAASLVLSAFATADAQGPRPFRDSWFWGLQGGATSFTEVNTADPAGPGNQTLAPHIGVDWLITRTSGGLYMSFGQSFLTGVGAVLNGPTAADSGFRLVDVQDLRRFNMALMGFPGDFIKLRPYVGVGFAFDYLAGAQAQLSPTDTDRQVDFATSAVNDTKAAIGPLFIAGAQYRALGAVSVFGQFTAAAMSKDFLLSNGHPISVGLQAGVRYNIGSSILKEY